MPTEAQNQVVVPVTTTAISLGTLQADKPAALIAGATELANALAGVIQSRGLSVKIQGRDYVRVEGWTTLGIMLGVVAREVSCTEQDGIYTAVVELVRIADQAVISRASAECGEESPWNKRPRYARRSMSLTRATGKACRMAFSWIMALTGYEVTPAEEVDMEGRQEPPIGPNSRQHKHLEAQLNELNLDRERVKAWVKRQWGIAHLPELTEPQYRVLLQQLPRFAEAMKRESAPVEVELDPEFSEEAEQINA